MLADLSHLTDEKDSLDNLIYTCKLILEKITYANKESLEAFLTYAAKSIFTDRNYAIELVLRDDTKKPALELTLTENGIQQEITDSVGGGIISTIGLLLQIYYIEVFNLSKIMFIDEGLKEISTGLNNESTESINYLNNLLEFLQWLSKERQYAFVIVTHDNNVRKFASTVYEVTLGEVRKC
jgi:ABC-type iron transport system FetAB ATPase subunit